MAFPTDSTYGSTYSAESFEDWTASTWLLGGSTSSSVPLYIGYMDDLRIYERVLTADEVADLADTSVGCGGDGGS